MKRTERDAAHGPRGARRRPRAAVGRVSGPCVPICISVSNGVASRAVWRVRAVRVRIKIIEPRSGLCIRAAYRKPYLLYCTCRTCTVHPPEGCNSAQRSRVKAERCTADDAVGRCADRTAPIQKPRARNAPSHLSRHHSIGIHRRAQRIYIRAELTLSMTL